MDLPQLRTLIQVAELGSLSKAADRLRVAQPALSRQVRLLEEELGTRLFTRHGRGMVLTETGQEALRSALRIMAELDEMRAHIADISTMLTGRVAIGLPPTVADMLSVSLVTAVRAEQPKLELRLVSAYTGHLIEWLQKGEIDLAVLYDPQPTRSVRSQPLLLEPLFLIGAAGAKLSKRRAVPFKSLLQEPLLLPSPRHGLRSIVERCAAQAGISLSVRIEADSYATLKDLVHSGYGKTILPIPPIHAEIAAGRLSAAPLVGPTPHRRLVLSQSADRVPTRAVLFAAATLRDAVRRLVESGAWRGQLLRPLAGSTPAPRRDT